ncbi:MAG: 50S ribosomal protein L5 [Dehalococcoidales bacterium]|jgi:large subunit ribosomal protein L5|nr:50S ribosomal protein L5 [Dehalococcoidales bacterium]
MAVLKEKYKNEVVPGLMERYGYANVLRVPRLEKVVINIGMGEAITNAKAMEAAERDLVAICGQHPVITRSKRSIAAFKLRAGMPIGLKVTLRGERMYDFLDKLMNVVLPRIREFNGVPRYGFDGFGNYTLGFKEQTYFPEISFEAVDKLRGLEITIVTKARTDEEGRQLLETLGMPFTKEEE